MVVNWDELETIALEEMNDPAFFALGRNYIPGEGDHEVSPKAFIIGEAPGAQEDIQRKPFAGKSGYVLRDLMSMVGLQSDYRSLNPEPNAWLTNSVKFRPPKNRNPFPSEIEAARPYLRREWVAVGKPQIIIPVGAIAFQAITGKQQSILMAAGKCHNYRNREGLDLYIWPMVHPAFGLRNKAAIPLLEEDWRRLGEWLTTHDQKYG